jgi:hypothetical protein
VLRGFVKFQEIQTNEEAERHTRVVSAEMKIVPKIKLEVLTPGQLRFILFLTYFSLAVGMQV